MSRYTMFFTGGVIWLLLLGFIVRPFPDGFVLFTGFAIGVFMTMTALNMYLDNHGK